MAKQEEYRFNLKFDEDDENHRRVSEYLNKCGRKKARYIVKAVLAYWELQNGRLPAAERSETPGILPPKPAAHHTEEKNKKDRLIRVEEESAVGLELDEAELMRQNYAMFGDME